MAERGAAGDLIPERHDHRNGHCDHREEHRSAGQDASSGHGTGWYGTGVSESSCADSGRQRASPSGALVLHPPQVLITGRGSAVAMTATTNTKARITRTRNVDVM